MPLEEVDIILYIISLLMSDGRALYFLIFRIFCGFRHKLRCRGFSDVALLKS